MTARTQTETAFGGMMLGMAMPLVAFGTGLFVDTADVLGLKSEPLVLPFGALIVLGALMLGSAGSTLLWWQRPAAPARTRRREVPVQRVYTPVQMRRPIAMDAMITLPIEPEPEATVSVSAELFADSELVTLTPILAVAKGPSRSLTEEATTKLVAFAGTQRRVRITARA